ncbi:MAG: response regulator [Kiritimatiellales bacterium]|jgi:CheY-like chemotaxis protein
MKHILIVDDDPVTQVVFSQFLEKKGFSTSVTDSGFSALLKVNEKEPDLIIADILMPGMDGITLIRELRRTYPALPLIAVSGGQHGATTDFEPQAEKNGADCFLRKPIHLNDLLQRIESLLQRA